MKKIFSAILLALLPVLAMAQGAPPNCPDTGGNHLNYTSATKAWSCGTSSSASGITIGSTTITGGATTQVLYNLAGVVQSSANLTFSATSPAAGSFLSAVSTAGGSNGLKIGGLDSTLNVGYIWNGTKTPDATNYNMRTSASGLILNADSSSGTMNFRIGGTDLMVIKPTGAAGEGVAITAGTATTDVAALSVTRTNNNAAVATGVKFTFTDTTSAAGFLPFQILCGAAGTTNCLSVDKNGTVLAPIHEVAAGGSFTTTSRGALKFQSDGVLSVFNNAQNDFGRLQFGGTTSSYPAIKRSSTALHARLADDSDFAPIAAKSYYNGSGDLTIAGTDPTIGSGGCTSPTVTNANGTAYFTIDVGTGCSGSQPVVFTLPAATTGWNCYARNITNGATSAPAQTGAVSTTSVTITNFVRTTGVAGAWTDGDDIVVSCLGG